MAPTRVMLEVGGSKTFASALDWPGWSRSAKGPDAALEVLADYADRYRDAVARSGVKLPASAAASFDVVQRLKGTATTDFGAPDREATLDAAPVTVAEARRMARIFEAAWAALEDAVARSVPTLRKGPRGGGRDRDAILAHVVDSQRGYARQIGVRHPPRTDAAVIRGDVLEVLGKPSDGRPLRPNGWRQRYAARRFTWHVLDHAWEIEDKQA